MSKITTKKAEYKTIEIHGNKYLPVSERVKMAHDSKIIKSITTEIIQHSPVIIKATVITDVGTFNGISAANPNKSIEKQSPYEVAETSAIGRALGFAGFGIAEGIASADEIMKADIGVVIPDVLKKQIENTKTIEALKSIYLKNKGLGKEFDKLVADHKKLLQSVAETEINEEE